MVSKLVEKGLTRHTLVQAILLDYLECQDDLDRIRHIADLVKEKLPALLASLKGLKVAVAMFNILEAKDRKAVVKSLPVAEMVSNKIAHLFVMHVFTTLDDTQLSKKKILHEALKQVDDLINDRIYQNVLLGALMPLPTLDGKKSLFTIQNEEIEALQYKKEWQTSKKNEQIRRKELVKIVQKPLEMFFEEKLQYYLFDINSTPVLRALCMAIAGSKFTICY